MKIILPILLLSLFYQSSISFKDYSIEECNEFKRVDSLIVDSLPQTDYVLANVRNQWKMQENHFACKYFVVTWGCGTGCQIFVIFNQMNGKEVGSISTNNGCEYQRNSRLIKVNTDPIHKTKERYFILEDNKLKEIKSP